MEEIIGYKWRLYYGTTLLRESDEIYDTEEEARAAAKEESEDRIEYWKSEGSWHGYDTDEDFDIVIEEITEWEEIDE